MKKRLEDIVSKDDKESIKEDDEESIKAGTLSLIAFWSGLSTVTHELGHYLMARFLGRNPRMVINSDVTGYVEYDSSDISANEYFAIGLSGPFGNIAGGSYLVYKGIRDRNRVYLGLGMAMIFDELYYQAMSLLYPEEGGDYVDLGTKLGINLPLIALPLTIFAAYFPMHMGKSKERQMTKEIAARRKT